MNRTLFAIILAATIVFAIGVAVYDCYGYSIRFNKSETTLMQMAYQEGKHLERPEILQAILLNETVAGRFGRLGDKHFKDWRRRSYGIMQVQFKTAKFILKKNRELYMSDEKLLLYLRSDDRFNIYVARLYVQYLWKKYKNWDYVLLAYNVGPKNIRKYKLEYDPNGYLAKAYFYFEHTIKKFNIPVRHSEMLARMVPWDIKQIITYNFWRNYTPKYVDKMYHTVIKGDTFSKLAKAYFGDMKRWTEIQELNPHVVPTNIKIGSTLLIKIRR